MEQYHVRGRLISTGSSSVDLPGVDGMVVRGMKGMRVVRVRMVRVVRVVRGWFGPN